MRRGSDCVLVVFEAGADGFFMSHDAHQDPIATIAAQRGEGHIWEGVSVAATRYEQDLVPALFEPWASVLMDLTGLKPGDRVLDLACGTGVVARAAARRVMPGGRVCGLDVNENMLAIARGAAPDVEWRQADASHIDLPDAAFDVAFCQQGLQFFPDRLAALRELRRVLVHGARTVIATWCATDDGDAGYAPIAAAFQRHLPDDPTPRGFIKAIFGLSDGTELARLAEAAGFGDVRVERRTGTVRFPSAAAWVAAFLAAAPVPSIATLDPATRAAVTADAASDLQPYVDSAGIAFPLHTNITRCRA